MAVERKTLLKYRLPDVSAGCHTADVARNWRAADRTLTHLFMDGPQIHSALVRFLQDVRLELAFESGSKVDLDKLPRGTSKCKLYYCNLVGGKPDRTQPPLADVSISVEDGKVQAILFHARSDLLGEWARKFERAQ
ncbi:hypothetical protein HY988_01345 [Candidatus Micrarchaeota archaeon]|nr:hypothetical protein [Candidatus Micrarchaeota archaeon]